MEEQQKCGYCGYPIGMNQGGFAHYKKWGLCHLRCGEEIEEHESLPQWQKDGYESFSAWDRARLERKVEDLEKRIITLELRLKTAYDMIYSATGG